MTKDMNARVTMSGTHTGYLLLMGERWSEAQHTCQPRLHEQAAGHTEMEKCPCTVLSDVQCRMATTFKASKTD